MSARKGRGGGAGGHYHVLLCAALLCTVVVVATLWVITGGATSGRAAGYVTKPRPFSRHDSFDCRCPGIPPFDRSRWGVYGTTFPDPAPLPPPDGAEFLVPNLIHYVWLSGGGAPAAEIELPHLLGPLSALAVLRPRRIMLHCDRKPTGTWWDAMFRAVPVVVRVIRAHAAAASPEHAADIARLDALIEYGGVYLDFDVVALRSLDAWRRRPCTLAREGATLVNSGVIVAERNSSFLRRWRASYDADYRPESWNYNSGAVPMRMAERDPEQCHLVDTVWQRYDPAIFRGHVDLSEFYACHLFLWTWFPTRRPKLRVCDHALYNSTFGDLMRRFYVESVCREA
ncbi:PREDICTED: uncharacterized protein LOC106820294 [Priapulus caudatus]|uniref:Uncharacterized protein LOC106820294 n=1 Tax=Priapulus caudatus TaxID=37621 RepID=A0ABM1F780_PRICU|nr:PREDICTED: uncharacterized protein LOC106820294 [Priapulus caudatus]